MTDPGAGAERRVIEHARALSSGLRRRSGEIAELKCKLDESLTAAAEQPPTADAGGCPGVAGRA